MRSEASSLSNSGHNRKNEGYQENPLIPYAGWGYSAKGTYHYFLLNWELDWVGCIGELPLDAGWLLVWGKTKITTGWS